MAKKSKKIDEKALAEILPKLPEMQAEYEHSLETDPEYSLNPDPEGKLQLNDIQKIFISHYVQFKSVATAAELTGIDMDVAKQFFISPVIQREIRRINRALYHRQFLHRLITVDEIGGYLSSLLMDENVPIADQLKTTEKIRIVELLLRLNEFKAMAMLDPNKVVMSDFEVSIKTLSVETIKQMLEANSAVEQKEQALAGIPTSRLTAEEREYLLTLPMDELLKLVEDIKKDNQ